MLSIPIKEANLFVKSQVSRKYPWLINAMIDNHRLPCLPQKDFNKLSKEHQDFLNLRWGTLFGLAQDEWKVNKKFIKNEEKCRIDCELCGHKELDLLSEIENIENGNKFTVGSTCIEKFEKIKNNNSTDYKNYQKLKKQKERITLNEEYIEQQVSGIVQLVRNFKEISNNKSIILNEKLQKDYNRIQGIIESDYEEQLKLLKNRIDLRKIQSTFSIITQFMQKLKIYIDDCKSKDWGINPDIARWCYNFGTEELIRLLQNFGKINKYTVDQIKEEKHLKNTISKFGDLFQENNIKLLNINANTFSVTSNIRSNIVIDVNTIQFINLKKDYLFDKKNTKIKINELLKISKINSQSFDAATTLICRNGKFKEVYKKFYSDNSINEIAFLNTTNKEIYTVNYNNFIQSFKHYIFEKKIDITQNQKLIDYIDSKSTKYSKSDYDEHLRLYGININK